MSDRDPPLVTIGICTYNRADSYLGQALRSAVDQTYANLEIIVSDNCSQDRTEEVVRSFEDPRIRYIRQERNLGVTPNFNFCVQEARGVYFLLLHDDDLIDPDFIETCMTSAGGRTDYGLIRTGMRRIDDEGAILGTRTNLVAGLPTKEFFRAWFHGGRTPMHLCCTLFNTEGLREVGGFHPDGSLFCDVVPESQVAARYGRLDIEEPKASFRIHGGKNAAKGRIEQWCKDSLHLLEVMLSLVEDEDGSLRKAGMHFFARHCLRYAGDVAPLQDRIAAYWTVYRSFDHANSYLFKRWVGRPGRRLVRRGVRGVRRVRAPLG